MQTRPLRRLDPCGYLSGQPSQDAVHCTTRVWLPTHSVATSFVACSCLCQCSRQCSGRACALTQSRRFVLRLSAAQPVPQVLLPAAAVDRDVIEATGTLSRRDVVEAAGRAAGPAGNRAADAPSFNDPQLFTNFNIFQRILSILIISEYFNVFYSC